MYLVEGNRKGLVVDSGIDQRSNIVEEAAFVERGVVLVNLACTLGSENNQLIV